MEKKTFSMPGIIVVIIQLGLVAYAIDHAWTYRHDKLDIILPLPAIFLFVAFLLFSGYIILDPNQAAVLSFLGKYKGTLKGNGFHFVNPFYSAKEWSLKISNHKTAILKVNEKDGVPIEISATIVWKINDTYKSQYDVENLEDYINNQFEISLRKFAQSHAYKQLSGEGLEFIDDLKEKVSKAGIEILDAKITHLNYASEIAGSMLQKQQATSLGEAKEIIVKTAVHIATNAANEIGVISKEEKAKFISNLIIVLCSEKSVTPTIQV